MCARYLNNSVGLQMNLYAARSILPAEAGRAVSSQWRFYFRPPHLFAVCRSLLIAYLINASSRACRRLLSGKPSEPTGSDRTRLLGQSRHSQFHLRLDDDERGHCSAELCNDL